MSAHGHADASESIICPMQCYSNRTDNYLVLVIHRNLLIYVITHVVIGITKNVVSLC